MTKDQALRLALEEIMTKSVCQTARTIAKDALRKALEQPEPEPVAFYVYKPNLPRGHLGNVSDGDLPWVYDQDPSSGYTARMLVYTSPPKREWRWLTDDEICPWFQENTALTNEAAMRITRAIEAKLKEKNT